MAQARFNTSGTGLRSSTIWLHPCHIVFQTGRAQKQSRSEVDGDKPCCSMTHPLHFSLQSEEKSELSRAVNKCFLLLEELGLCFSAPSPAQETNRHPPAASLCDSIVVYKCSWCLADAKIQRNVLLNVQINVSRKSYGTSTGMHPSPLRRENTLFRSVCSLPNFWKIVSCGTSVTWTGPDCCHSNAGHLCGAGFFSTISCLVILGRCPRGSGSRDSTLVRPPT